MCEVEVGSKLVKRDGPCRIETLELLEKTWKKGGKGNEDGEEFLLLALARLGHCLT